MAIKMKRSYGKLRAGQTYELRDDKERHLVAIGAAEATSEKPQAEKATTPKAELKD